MNEISPESLSTIWRHRRQQVLNTEPADRAAAESVIGELYHTLDRPAPEIVWYDGNNIIRDAKMPLNGVADRIFYGVWFKIPNIEQSLTPFGFDPGEGQFRIAANKHIVFGNFRVKRQRLNYLRPSWTRNLRNMISQFDAPQLAVYEYVAASRRLDNDLDNGLRAAGDAFRRLLDTAFGAILFDNFCLLIDRPKIIALDTMDRISSTSGPAFALHTNDHDAVRPIYAVNGVRIPYENYHDINMERITWPNLLIANTPQIRVAMIEYMSWGTFMKIVPSHAKRIIDRNTRWGILYEIRCNNQVITVVTLRNRTAEPDGRYLEFIQPVDSLCRPLPNPLDPLGEMGAPQELTALNAVASTFGMTGVEYQAILGDES